MTKNNNTTTTTNTTEPRKVCIFTNQLADLVPIAEIRATSQIVAYAQVCTATALRTLESIKGDRTIGDIRRQYASDRRATRAHITAYRADELREAKDTARTISTHAKRKSERVTLSADNRATAYRVHLDQSATADRLAGELHDLDKLTALTLSDRADIEQTARLAVLEQMRRPTAPSAHILASYGAETLDELDEADRAEAQEHASRREVYRAINAYIMSQKGQTSHTSTRNATRDQIPAELEARVCAELATDAPNPIDHNGTTYAPTLCADGITYEYRHETKNGGYRSITYRDTKSRKGWHFVDHYTTTRNIKRIEDFRDAEGEQLDITSIIEFFSTHEIPTEAEAKREALDRIAHKLTKTQRELLAHMFSAEADRVAQSARNKYYRTAEKPSNATANGIEAEARKDYALTACEIDTKEARKKTLQRLRAKLTEALEAERKTAQAPQTEPKRADLLQFAFDGIEKRTFAYNGAVEWLTADEMQTAREAHRAREAERESTINNATAKAQRSAHFAELRYTLQKATGATGAEIVAKLTERELEELRDRLTAHRARESARAEAERNRRERAEAERKAREERERAEERRKTSVFLFKFERRQFAPLTAWRFNNLTEATRQAIAESYIDR